jgi:hypothetical protein
MLLGVAFLIGAVAAVIGGVILVADGMFGIGGAVYFFMQY